ncbi:MAG: tRNA 2-selenouridine(34) synthase MnmH [Tissierellia bacterium]|nr:tRNA 2-selenouridine(34) synthase MnmH [Tissierellia bacterium]
MNREYQYEQLIQLNKNFLFIDLRSPYEYTKETIPGAINIPILDDETRVKVGTLYDHDHFSEAKSAGVQFVCKNLPKIIQMILDLDEEKTPVLFCSRGGYRSTILFELCKDLNIPVYKIHGGYKDYRRFIRKKLKEQILSFHFVTLYGLTGTGKTKILKELSHLGAQVLDIEDLCNHRGSALGHIGLGEQPSQKMFESILYEHLSNFHKSQIIYTEGESQRVGKLLLPQSLYQKINEDTKILITASMNKRIAIIKEEYTHYPKSLLHETIGNLKNILPPKKLRQFQEQIEDENFEALIRELMVHYYDPKYRHGHHHFEKQFENIDEKKTALDILENYGL